MPKKRQALVEFEDMMGACNAVNYASDNQVYIAGHPAFVNYSTSQKISRPGESDDSRGVNNVLLFTILNPIYSITTVRGGLVPRVCALRVRDLLVAFSPASGQIVGVMPGRSCMALKCQSGLGPSLWFSFLHQCTGYLGLGNSSHLL